MPIYDYRCSDCSHEFEALQKLSDALLTTCPECGKETLRKQVSAPAFRLAGSGWYETDFKKDKQRNLADGAKPTASADKVAKSDAASTSKKTDGSAAKSE